jgi:hypothetical protein
MPFREKRAWISLCVIGLVSVVYFPMMLTAYITSENFQPSFAYLSELALAAIIAFIVLELLLQIGLRFYTPADERLPKDERERFIEAEATRIAYVSFMILAFITAVLVVHHPGRFSWFNGNLVILSIALAELIKYGMIIYKHRWGA